jgi:hypothetical protein
MGDSVTVDAKDLEHWIWVFQREFNVDVFMFVKRQMRLMLRDFIRWSPPESLSLAREKITRDFRRSSEVLGSEQISKGLSRLNSKNLRFGIEQRADMVTAASDEQVFTFQMARANELIQRKDYQGLNALLRNLKGKLSKWYALPFSTGLFYGATRGARGGVRQQKRFVMEKAQWKSQLSKICKHAGRLKAGWLPAYYSVGGKTVAKWIDDHRTGARGDVQLPDVNADAKVCVAVNCALGVGKTRAIVGRAIEARGNATRREFFLFYYGKKDIEKFRGEFGFDES